jgi:hypothetical protein
MVNLSGGCWFSRPEYERLPKIFIDTDPGFTQLAINRAGPGWYQDFFASHETLFTFALNVDSPNCRLAVTPFRWHPTMQPIALDFWPVVPPPASAPYTAIMSWRSDSFPGLGKDKGAHLTSLIDLPGKLPCRVLLAIAGQAPADLLLRHKWELTDGVKATIDAFAYRDFIRNSRAELGFAKPMYVDTRSGWFSDRTLCYLATGRPALVCDTGISEYLPCGEGLFVFENEQDVRETIDEIEKDYARHARKARAIAEDLFASEKVVRQLLQTANAI